MIREIRATKPTIANIENYINEIKSIWDSKTMTNNGEKVEKFKKMLIEYTKCKNVDLFVNGHSALLLAIKVLNLHGEIITSPFTFVSTTNAIVQNGLTPVFGDIDDTYNLAPESIEELITDRTSAIITPHIFGIPCNVEKIDQIAKKYGLKVIYDGAQAFGTKINGSDISCFGDIVMFSFHAVKIFNSIEGGMLSYADSTLHSKLDLYRNFGISYQEQGTDVEVVGMNAKMNEFQAAMGIVNLYGLEKEIEKRKKLAQVYCECLKDIPGISTYNYNPYIKYNYAYFPVKISEEYGMTRNELWTKLKEQKIGTRKLYDKLTCDYSCYKNARYVRSTKYADKIKNLVLDFPIYGTLTEEDIFYICQKIREMKK